MNAINNRPLIGLLTSLMFIFVLASCNLGGTPEEQLSVTDVPTNAGNPTRTPASTSNIPTGQAVTQLPIATSIISSTSLAVIPTSSFPTPTPLPISIVILSPIPGNVVAGNVQILGAASHPQFLQYQVEYGPDPNPNNLWFPITGVVQAPVTSNGLLGIWNTNTAQDGVYQLRLRVFLRDGNDLRTVVNNIRVQNQAPTPVPTNTQTIPRPIAAFTQDRATGNAPLVVRFTNQSSGQINSYSWNFGDNSTSNEINPAHTFNNPGTYLVSLTVTGPGGTSNVSRQINVQSTTPPVASFIQDRTSGPSPLNVQFTNQSVGEITALEWNFGDGTTSNIANPLHQFTAVGTYNVILRVAGPGGSSSATRQITVENPAVPPPNAGFLPDTTVSGDIPLTVQFTNQSTGDISTYNWDFGDGTPTSNLENPIHTYTQAGEYTVNLTVTGEGGQDTAQVQVVAVQPPDVPTASFTIIGDSSGRIPFTATFNNTSSGEITDYLWDFGDGNTSTTSDVVVSHEYTQEGTYTVTLTVANESGSSSFEQTVAALAPLSPPNALFTANPEGGPAPLTVDFTNQSSGDNLTFNWNFGDGSPISNSSEATIQHTFANEGTYDVVLTVSNVEENLSDSHTVQINVSEAIAEIDPISGNFIATETTPSIIDFNASSTGGDGVYTYDWDFGDGNTDNGQTAQHTYATGGTFTVTLTISDSSGTTPAVISQQVTVTEPITLDLLSASFTFAENSPLVVDFNATASGGDGTYTYTWDFGDGNTGNGQITQHTYAAGNTYTVTLTVSDSSGTTPAVVSQQVTVTEPITLDPLSASFTFAENSPLVVDFNATASGGDGTYTYTWDFGDGNTGNGQITQHTYAAGNTYTVTLTVSDSSGTTPAVVSQQVTVTEPITLDPLSASFTFAENSPLVVDFNATASGGDGTYTYNWDFGDGNTGDGQTTQHTYVSGGTFTVTLTISDSSGTTPAVVSQQVTVTEPITLDPLSASFTFAENSPLVVDFNATASGGDGTYTYTWDFGDGNTGNGQTTQHTYATGNTYTVTLTVSDASGTTPAVVSQQVTVTEPITLDPLSASFTFAENSPLVVDFNATASGGDGTYTYTWDFGDGNTGNGQITQHTYAAGNTYTVTLTVSDASGTTPAVVSQQVTVTEPITLDPLSASFTFAENSPLVVDFNATASGGDGTYTYTWDFGDGNTGNGQITQHTYAAGNTYTVTLTVSDASGTTPAVVSQQVTVTEPITLDLLSASFTFAENSPLVVDFNATASGGDGTYTYTWDFGDGNTGNGQITQHTYATGNTYTVTLTVSDASGTTPAVVSQQVTVTEPITLDPLSASFTFAENSPLVVDFNATASGGDGTYTYTWDFGDGNTGNGQITQHTYATGNTYTVTLTVSDASGTTPAVVSQQVTVTEPTQPTLAETTPIQPDVNALIGSLSRLYQGGIAQGRQADRFAIVGDQTANNPNYLDPFDNTDPSTFTLEAGVTSNLQTVIDIYNADSTDATSSFNRTSFATGDLLAEDMLMPGINYNSACTEPGETLLDCEIRFTNPSLIIVNLGYAEVQRSVEPATFEANLQQIINASLANNVIPILSTVIPNLSDQGIIDRTEAINEIIINLANANGVPLLNQWRALHELPNSGLSGDNVTPSVAPEGAGTLTQATLNSGANMRNFQILTLLNSIQTTIFR